MLRRVVSERSGAKIPNLTLKHPVTCLARGGGDSAKPVPGLIGRLPNARGGVASRRIGSPHNAGPAKALPGFRFEQAVPDRPTPWCSPSPA